MSGRLEEELKIENKLKRKLNGQCDIVNDYADSFIDETYNTKLNYINQVINFIRFMRDEYGIDLVDEKSFKKIKKKHINNYINSNKYKMVDGKIEKNVNSYLSNQLSALRHFFYYLTSDGVIDTNPCEGIKNPKDKRKHEITSLTKEEIKILENNIVNGVGSKRAIAYQKKWSSRDLAIVAIGITTGLRVSAICNINLSDINYEKNTITVVEKGDIERDIIVPDSTIEVINKWKSARKRILDGEENDALFISNRRKRITTDSVRDLLTKYTYNIDKHITPHKLRSTVATNLLDETGDIYLVADVLGHKNIQNTKRYAKISNAKKEKAAAYLGNLL